MHRFAAFTCPDMILSCPNCATQYTVNDAVIGMRGRTVRCAACKTTWHADTPIDLRYSEKMEEAEVEEEPAQDLRTIKAKKLPGKYRAMLQQNARLRAVAVEGLVWGGLAVAAVAVLAIAYMLRVDIVKAFPRIAGAYAMVGLPVNASGLQLSKQTGEVNFKGGRFVVTVKAQVNNPGDKPMPVPPVRVKLLDSTSQVFDSVLMPSGGLVVAPHATRTLTFDVADPKNQVATLDLRFDLEAMKAMKGRPAPAAVHDDTPDAAAKPAPLAVAEAEVVSPPQPLDTDASGEDVARDPSAEVPPASEEALSSHPGPALRPALRPTLAADPAAAKKGHG